MALFVHFLLWPMGYKMGATDPHPDLAILFGAAHPPSIGTLQSRLQLEVNR